MQRDLPEIVKIRGVLGGLRDLRHAAVFLRRRVL